MQPQGAAVEVLGQRAECLDCDQPFDPFRRGGSHHARDRRTERMPEQGEAVPPERVGHREHRARGVDHGVLGRGRQVRAGAMAGQVGGDQLDSRQVRLQRHEAGRVVEPTVQREHPRRARRPTAQAGEASEVGVDDELAQRAHAH